MVSSGGYRPFISRQTVISTRISGTENGGTKEPYSRLFLGWVFSYISPIHTTCIGFRTSIWRYLKCLVILRERNLYPWDDPSGLQKPGLVTLGLKIFRNSSPEVSGRISWKDMSFYNYQVSADLLIFRGVNLGKNPEPELCGSKGLTGGQTIHTWNPWVFHHPRGKLYHYTLYKPDFLGWNSCTKPPFGMTNRRFGRLDK